MKVKPYCFVPTLMASLLAVALAGCSSSGSSYSPDRATDKAKQEEQKAKEKIANKRAEAEKIKADATQKAKDLEEKVRLETEKAKQELEKARLETEKTKVQADKRAKELEENARLAEKRAEEQTEKARLEAEKAKIEAEKQVKEQSERSRLAAEKAKQEAENSRIKAEKAKQEAANSRIEAEKAKQEVEKARLEAEKAREAAEVARLEVEKEKEQKDLAEIARVEAEQKLAEQKQAWRTFEVVNSSDGGYKYDPVYLAGKEAAYYSSGPVVLSKGGKAVKLDSADLQYDRDFLKKGEVNPNTVQHLEITDTDGTVLGKFQFVNQDHSSYATFVSAKPASLYGHTDKIEPLAFYTAKLSTESQLAQQKGTFDYNGKALGYQGGVKGGTPTQEAVADVHFEVNFDTKKIKGEMTNRFDGLTKNSFGLTKGWDSNDNPIYYPEHNDLTRSLILKETDIKVENGIVGFGHKGVVDGNVGIIAGGQYRDVTDYGGVFAGPNLENIVGQIGGGEERIMFGATKADAPKTEVPQGE